MVDSENDKQIPSTARPFQASTANSKVSSVNKNTVESNTPFLVRIAECPFLCHTFAF
jgi:hypothetical protein